MAQTRGTERRNLDTQSTKTATRTRSSRVSALRDCSSVVTAHASSSTGRIVLDPASIPSFCEPSEQNVLGGEKLIQDLFEYGVPKGTLNKIRHLPSNQQASLCQAVIASSTGGINDPENVMIAVAAEILRTVTLQELESIVDVGKSEENLLPSAALALTAAGFIFNYQKRGTKISKSTTTDQFGVSLASRETEMKKISLKSVKSKQMVIHQPSEAARLDNRSTKTAARTRSSRVSALRDCSSVVTAHASSSTGNKVVDPASIPSFCEPSEQNVQGGEKKFKTPSPSVSSEAPPILDILRSSYVVNEQLHRGLPSDIMDNSKPKSPTPLRTFRVNDNSYVAIRQVGSGGSAKVYEVYRNGPKSVEKYALKIIKVNGDFRIFQDNLNRCIDEIGFLKRLHDQVNIVNLFASEVDLENRKVSLVLELGDCDLNHILSDLKIMRKPFNPHLIRGYWSEMLQSIHVLHQHDIIHGDLKPSNFILVKSRIKLIDFGISLVKPMEETSVQLTAAQGSPYFMAPECLPYTSDPPKKGKESDVWAMGIILYSMSYYVTPFEGSRDEHELLNAIKRGGIRYEPLVNTFTEERVSEEAVEAMQACLHVDRKQRRTIKYLLHETRFLN